MEDSSFYHQQKKPQFPGQEQHLKCPRCGSTNTKFCYYNNYNLSQPRHFCKDCRRYWTKGGALRNIPVGGGIRKNTKRSSNTTRHSSSSSQSLPSLPFPPPQLRGTVGLSLPSFDQDRRTMEMSGSFSSLLASNGQFGNPFGSSTLQLSELSENQYSVLGSASVIRNIENGDSERVVGVQSNGESSCWNGGNEWPNLAIYTP